LGGTPAIHARSEPKAVKRLPKELAAQAKSGMRAACKLAAKDGMGKLSRQAKRLQAARLPGRTRRWKASSRL